MKLVFISDVHNKFNELTIPECDILVDSGDYSFRGTEVEIINFYTWLSKQPAKYIVSVQGNHELGWEKNPALSRRIAQDLCLNVHLLHDSSVTLEGIKFYGSPYQPEFFDWAYNLPRGPKLADKWKLIPDDTDILVTHGPPYGILDAVKNGKKIESVGCVDLRDRVNKLPNLKYHSFGHLHLNGGRKTVIGNTTFINAAVNNDSYNVVNKPVEINYEII